MTPSERMARDLRVHLAVLNNGGLSACGEPLGASALQVSVVTCSGCLAAIVAVTS